MIEFLANYAVPLNLVLLMLIAGTEVTGADFRAVRGQPTAVALGSAAQLFTLPLLALLVIWCLKPHEVVATGTLLLALCPGGGISNSYCYVARSNVLLSAVITAASTVLSLFTIPLWAQQIDQLSAQTSALAAIPVGKVVSELLAFMVLPLTVGALLRFLMPGAVKQVQPLLRTASAVIIALILLLATASVRQQLAVHAADIFVTVGFFILLAMLAGWLLGLGQSPSNRAVLVIESGVRNIGVALILGRALFSQEDFALFACFLTGYFAVEIVIMLTYAKWISAHIGYDRR